MQLTSTCNRQFCFSRFTSQSIEDCLCHRSGHPSSAMSCQQLWRISRACLKINQLLASPVPVSACAVAPLLKLQRDRSRSNRSFLWPGTACIFDGPCVLLLDDLTLSLDTSLPMCHINCHDICCRARCTVSEWIRTCTRRGRPSNCPSSLERLHSKMAPLH